MSTYDDTRRAWDDASSKHVREYAEHLEQARTARLLPIEEELLRPLIGGVEVLHPQSGHGLDDHALLRIGARSVRGLDYSPTAVSAAQRRADELDVPCRYEVAELPDTGLPGQVADLVYTGKGALIWMEDLDAWAAEMHRLVRPGGHLFVYEAHPLVPLWAWDHDEARVREDRSYFAAHHVNDTFPARGATEHQRTLAEMVMTVQGVGFELLHLAEHPQPFWRPEDEEPAAAWGGRLPNALSLLARRRS
ncbi:bifunctional 2-polyprenyl-6-hydroxyphenol methylase/3-demethylubiquinol 3-O-methyltransferase UbiG [uncultured Brachybacterium sp.]|uniref:class I SAM-dependent methyltransferase n=1 Tax=uncultured Brachybacterium sp. TaxID=189680 RepID=UPI002626678A|nr:class I SAM-dependent methyltransferase [uncultured Brachybacterium sp.]